VDLFQGQTFAVVAKELQVTLAQIKEGEGRSFSFIFEVDEGAGELDEGFVECVQGRVAAFEPEVFQDVVRFVESAFVEGLEIAPVTRIPDSTVRECFSENPHTLFFCAHLPHI
jgi:hypothetical protein